ncbi:MAG TPA: 2-oxo-4-hydroxy-4-carboxy-5-ureidoimidazoline decarboxylase, partial [Burkholderiaceae bacterium]
MGITLDQLNAANATDFVALLAGTYEHSPWVAERAHAHAPFKSLAQLQCALARVVREAAIDEQLALIRAHPELAGKAMVSKSLTVESTDEQSRAGLTHCTREDFE